MKTFDYLNEYYNSRNEDERLDSRHGQVEYLTTMRYIQKYSKPEMKILEVGAGTGRYSIALAKLGCTVEAVELIPHNIDIFKHKITAEENVVVRQGNAKDLSCFADASFDITLVLGPMYHLYTVDDQKQALSEAIRVTKNGGLLFSAYCISDASVICDAFKGGHIFEYISKGLIDTETFKTFSTPEDLFQLYRKEDIDALDSGFNVTRLHYVATDLMTNYMREVIDAMDDELFVMYLKYHFAVCERSDLVGATHHSLDILRKVK
ncbi:MAG: class I SAM-dependent methyltransferase [Eubacteriales bacterium]